MSDEAHRFRKCAADLRDIASAAGTSKSDRQTLERIARDLEAEAERAEARSRSGLRKI